MPAETMEELAKVVLEDCPDAFLQLKARALSISPEHLSQVRLPLEGIHQDLRQTIVCQLAQILKDRQLDMVVFTHPDADHSTVAEAKQHFLESLMQKNSTAASPAHLTPELREWACSLYKEAEIVAGLQE